MLRCEDLATRAKHVIPGGILSPGRMLPKPIVFSRAKGAYLYDADGNQYTDYHCGFGANILGHCNEAIISAVKDNLDQVDLIASGLLDLEIEVAEILTEIIPCAEQVNFCNSGSEATYHALRLARAATGRKYIIKFQGGYHGWHDYVAMNVQSERQMIGSFDPISAGILDEAAHYTKVLPYNNIDAVRDFVISHRDEVAAVILEPVAHNVGSIRARDQFLTDLRQVTTEHGVILIFDEVITGFRHALGGYQSIVGVTPDLATFGKAASGNFPLGIVAGRRDIMERVGRVGKGSVFLAGTFNGNPACLAAVKATIGELSKPGTYEKLFEQGEYIRKNISDILSRAGVRAQVAGFGSVWLIYFLDGEFNSYSDLLRNDNELDTKFRHAMIDRNYVFQPVPMKRMYMSLAHTRDIIDQTLSDVEDVVRIVASK